MAPIIRVENVVVKIETEQALDERFLVRNGAKYDYVFPGARWDIDESVVVRAFGGGTIICFGAISPKDAEEAIGSILSLLKMAYTKKMITSVMVLVTATMSGAVTDMQRLADLLGTEYETLYRQDIAFPAVYVKHGEDTASTTARIYETGRIVCTAKTMELAVRTVRRIDEVIRAGGLGGEDRSA